MDNSCWKSDAIGGDGALRRRVPVISPVGIDPSLNGVLAARRVTQQLGIDACFAVADGRYLPFRTGTFDQVFSYSVLQHLSKPDVCEILTDVARVLRPGGRSLIQMANMFGVRCLYHQGPSRISRDAWI